MNIFRTKTVEQTIKEADEGEHKLKRELSALDLLVFGIGIIIGTGIFVLTGIAAATKAGPAIVFSFVFSGITCAFAALCYAEFASTVPVAGSTYTFAYASMGEFVAWFIGWDLLLEVIVGASAISVSWAKYFNTILSLSRYPPASCHYRRKILCLWPLLQSPGYLHRGTAHHHRNDRYSRERALQSCRNVD